MADFPLKSALPLVKGPHRLGQCLIRPLARVKAGNASNLDSFYVGKEVILQARPHRNHDTKAQQKTLYAADCEG